MKICTIALGRLIAGQATAVSFAAAIGAKRESNFDRDWRFLKSDAPGAEDAAGNLMPDATNLVRFALSGPGELAAVGSGAPNVMESFRQPRHTTWHERCLAILRPLGASGRITLKAEADVLKAATMVVNTR